MIGELVEYLAKNLVNNVDEVSVIESSDDSTSENQVAVAVKVAADDYGRIIGKSGQTIEAIRKLAAVVGQRQELDVTVEVIDLEEWNRRSPE